MAIAIFTFIVALISVNVSFKKINIPLNLICFATYSSTVIQTVCTLVKWFLYTIAYMFSAAYLSILREANQRMIKSKDYRILVFTEQIQGIKYAVVYCVVYSSLHSLGRCIAT
jgi:hypothetical protein